MNKLIALCFTRPLTVLLILALLLVGGAVSWQKIAKEAAPDIEIPIFFVSVTYSGISPEDAERLLTRPLERELQTIAGLDEMQSRSGEGFALIQLDFDPGHDNRRALQDVRERVDTVRPTLPPGTDEPQVTEVDLSMFPVLTVMLSGPLPERSLVRMARELRDDIEGLSGVLEVNIGGDRSDLVEVMLDPNTIETYRIPYHQLIQVVQRNNQLVAAGAMDTGAGRINLKVPGVIENWQDVLDLPVKVEQGRVVSFADVASVRRTFDDPQGFARINGQPAIALEIRKRAGANILDAVAGTRELIEQHSNEWPDALQVTYMQDMARDVDDLLGDLQNNVLVAVLLVMLTVVTILGGRASWLVGLAIPGAFLSTILVLLLLGYTLNIVVLFALILVVGMLVDGAIVVVEQADRYLAEDMPRSEAYLRASQRMAWPIIASVATTLAVFVPLLFWPGMVGSFLFYLPATVLIALLASLLMALVFIPVLGSVAGANHPSRREQVERIRAAERGEYEKLDGFTATYVNCLRWMVFHPLQTLAFALMLVIVFYLAYGNFGRGLDFFPEIEPRFIQVQVQARGDLSVHEADRLVREVEQTIIGQPHIKTVYSRTIGTQNQRLLSSYPEDVIGIIQLELDEWRDRPPAAVILPALRERTATTAGVKLQIRQQQGGPGMDKPVQLEISGIDRQKMQTTTETLYKLMSKLGGFTDVEDNRSLPGIDLRLEVDHREAARHGADINLLGNAVQLLTNGLRLGGYRPDDSDEEVDIRVRFPFDERNLAELVNLRIPTQTGMVPISNFVQFVPAPSTGIIKRSNGRRSVTVQADVAPGYLADERIRSLQSALETKTVPEGVNIRFRGQIEDQQETSAFLLMAFSLSVFLMLLMLVTQFNSFYQALLVLSAILFSTAGVLMGLLLRQEPFSMVMSGIGVIALAGIIVNNNIVLIDSYNVMRRTLDPVESALRCGAQRLRPVLLTTVTTILGLMPMVLALTVDLAGREISHGGPSTDYWVQLSTAIVGGLLLATPLTLLLTPAMLVLGDRKGKKYNEETV